MNRDNEVKNVGNTHVSYLVGTTPFVIRLCAKVYVNPAEALVEVQNTE